jgi:hypothetical protein
LKVERFRIMSRTSTEILEKILTQTERKRKFIRIPAKYLSKFPAVGKRFELSMGDEIIQSYIDKESRLLLGRGPGAKIGLADPNIMITIEKDKILNRYYLIIS